ncbi:CDP-alcohol phosphatidyltransferase family protein [Spongiimicrobium sp. 3-5]|uniref:CDP-alcohol phosphatidyltransferase family protein n=1 Tax=Spongiimicrobium sp. 3-5 TaxID=3332596 RepID=UPI00397FDF0E
MKKQIPNIITMLNLFCGCVAVVFAAMNQLEFAALFVVIGIFFDFFDGLAARLLNVQSPLGVQLDSLADMITSGLVPGIVMFQLLAMSVGSEPIMAGSESSNNMFSLDMRVTPIAFLGFLITMASAYRLAKFNIDENQVSSFIGLPTPANALSVISLPLIVLYHGNDFLNEIILNQWFLIGFTLLSSYLLNARIALFALKFKGWTFKDNAVRYVFIIVSLVLLMTMKFLAIPAIIAFYILSSLVNTWNTNS